MIETTFIFNIGMYQLLGIVASIVIGAWYLSGRLARVETKVEGFDTRLTNFEGRLDNAFGSASPISLKPTGIKALEESGLKNWIDNKREKLVSECETKNIVKNQYDIQECAFKFFDSLDFGDFNDKIKQSAFQYGWSVETIRRIGGIYFRDILLEKHNFKPEDLDKPNEARTYELG